MSGAHDDDVLGKAYDARLMRRLLQYLRPYSRQVAVALVAIVAGGSASLAQPYLIKIVIDHPREAAQFVPDCLCLLDNRFEDTILGPVLVDKVVAENFGRRLELAIDASIPLFKAARVPGHIEVKEAIAVSLKI